MFHIQDSLKDIYLAARFLSFFFANTPFKIAFAYSGRHIYHMHDINQSLLIKIFAHIYFSYIWPNVKFEVSNENIGSPMKWLGSPMKIWGFSRKVFGSQRKSGFSNECILVFYKNLGVGNENLGSQWKADGLEWKSGGFQGKSQRKSGVSNEFILVFYKNMEVGNKNLRSQ